MSINTNGTGGPSQVGGVAANATSDVSRKDEAQGGARFREFVEQSASTKSEATTSASEAYHSAVQAVAKDIKVEDRRVIDDGAIEEVVELAVRAQFEGRLSEEELIERVEDAVFMLADDPSFAPATIEALRSAIDDRE